MSQHSGTLVSARGNVFRGDANVLLGAVRSSNSGAVEPTVKVAGMLWYDTSQVTPVLRIRSADNLSWLVVAFGDETPPNMSLYKSGSQWTAPNVWTRVAFDRVRNNDRAGLVSADGAWTAAQANSYFVTAQVLIDGSGGETATTNVQLAIFRDEGLLRRKVEYIAFTGEYHIIEVTGMIGASGSSVFDVKFWHNYGPGIWIAGADSSITQFTAFKI